MSKPNTPTKLTELQRFLKILTDGKGKRYARLCSLVQAGNYKLPKTMAIFNMGSATDCPSKRLGLCQAIVDGKNVCYAKKSENSSRPSVLPYRRKQEKYWKDTSATDFVAEFVLMNTLKSKPFNALRLNESGDFWSQECVDKAEKIARMLKGFGVKVYCYTARSDLDFSKCRDLIVSGSGFKKKGISNIFTMVETKEDRPKGYGICVGDCKICKRCMIKGRKTVVLKH